ncbi:UNVERIFIED_CONTAM: hypothetical protein Sindi_0623500 [Sesamum indicum]
MVRGAEQCVEVAPLPVLFPAKPSHCPTLETIREERSPEDHDWDDNYFILIFNLKYWFLHILSRFQLFGDRDEIFLDDLLPAFYAAQVAET